MTAQPSGILGNLLGHGAGYDVCAQSMDAKRSKRVVPAAEAGESAALPLRPAWGASDARWRRRMVAGVWILVLMPLMDLLREIGWALRIHVPAIFGFGEGFHTLDDTFLASTIIYPTLIFCMGAVLLFSRERGRRGSRLDWTCRWGIFTSYLTLLLYVLQILFIVALVSVGVGALFQSMAAKYQPAYADWFGNLGATYLHYGPQPGMACHLVRVATASVVMLLACVPLFNALRSSGPKYLAAVLTVPLAVFSVMQIVLVGAYCLGFSGVSPEVWNYAVYFRSDVLARGVVPHHVGSNMSGWDFVAFRVEAVKWCIVLAIAIWLSIAQVSTWQRGYKARGERL